MYYATELFIKKGALGKLWLAGTLFKKLSKKAILESDIGSLCEQVESPPIPLAISTCGKLTFGIVKIYEFQVGVVLKAANDSYLQLLRFGQRTNAKKKNITLPSNALRANTETITIAQRPLVQMPDIGNIDLMHIQFENQQRRNEIDEDLIGMNSFKMYTGTHYNNST